MRKTLIATVVVAIAFPAFAQQQPGRQPANPDANTPAVNSPNSPPNPGAPVAGANSFTEGQARSWTVGDDRRSRTMHGSCHRSRAVARKRNCL